MEHTELCSLRPLEQMCTTFDVRTFDTGANELVEHFGSLTYDRDTYNMTGFKRPSRDKAQLRIGGARIDGTNVCDVWFILVSAFDFDVCYELLAEFCCRYMNLAPHIFTACNALDYKSIS